MIRNNFLFFRIQSPVGCLFHSQEVSVSSLLSENIPIEIAPTIQTTTPAPFTPLATTEPDTIAPTEAVDDDTPVARDGIQIDPTDKPAPKLSDEDEEAPVDNSSPDTPVQPAQPPSPDTPDTPVKPAEDYDETDPDDEDDGGVVREDGEVEINVLTTEASPDKVPKASTTPIPKTQGNPIETQGHIRRIIPSLCLNNKLQLKIKLFRNC